MEKRKMCLRKYLLFTVFLISAVLYSTSIFGGNIRVPTDYPTIQDGIDAAANGDIVIVADGIYVGSGNKDLDFKGKAIIVRSENGPDNCIIDCQGNGRGFHFYSGETQSSVVSGFTITNGHAKYGGAIECNTASPKITNCKIVGNSADNVGGGIRCGSGWWSSCTITNCIIIGNSALWGGGIYLNDARAIITNCTIAGNTASWGGAMRISASPAKITNCILWGDTPSELSIDPGGVPPITPTISYCDIETYEHTDPTTIHTDPLFVNISDENLAKWDLHLQLSSPCIDNGSNEAPGIPDTDFEGDSRIIDGDDNGIATVDMGADEYTLDGIKADFIAKPTNGVVPLTVHFTDQSIGDIISRNWDFGDNTTSMDINPSHTYNNIGLYTVSLTVYGSEGSHTETKQDYIKVRPGGPIAMPWIPLLLLEESFQTDWIAIMSEDFEEIFPSSSWRVSGDPTWGDDEYKPHGGSKSAWCARGGPSGIDPMTNDYPNNMNAWMIYGPFDLSDAYDAELIFQLWLKSETGYDYFKWLASIDGTHFYGEGLSGNTHGWVEKNFDLRSVYTLGNLCGESEVWIAFKFQSDSSITDEGAFIDDVFLRKKVTQ